MLTNTPTPHNSAKAGEIAETVIMPGDPLRAKYIAENFLEEAVEYNHVRGMLGYTGKYKGKKISVQGHGMGIPSIGIYTYELFHFYGVERIIRVGSSGALQPQIQVGDIVIAMGACTDSNYAAQYNLPGYFSPICSYSMLEKVVAETRKQNVSVHIGNVLSSDVFYKPNDTANEKWAAMGVLSVEMEAMGLYCNAAAAGKEALCITTVSDHIVTGEAMTAQQRQTEFKMMMRIALEAALVL